QRRPRRHVGFESKTSVADIDDADGDVGDPRLDRRGKRFARPSPLASLNLELLGNQLQQRPGLEGLRDVVGAVAARLGFNNWIRVPGDDDGTGGRRERLAEQNELQSVEFL